MSKPLELVRILSTEIHSPQKLDSQDYCFKHTDLGNAEKLVTLHGKDLRFCPNWNCWLVWDGTRWAKDDTGEVYRRAIDTVRHRYSEAVLTTDSQARRELANHATKSENGIKLKMMVEVAKYLPGIPVTPDQLDQNPLLLNLTNGTLDLQTGQLLKHRREDLITKLASVDYCPTAECPSWMAFLNRVMNDNHPLINFLQKLTGYCLTGKTTEQVLAILYGVGANGKSTYLDTISKLLGDYAQQTATETIMVKRNDGIPNDLARLKGARFVAAVEAEEGKRLAEALVKQLTGGDKITARFMRAEWFEFKPEFKLLLATNHKPEIRGNDLAIWRRIRLIPFNITIPEAERDPDLSRKLEEELPGILNWAVKGCLLWQSEGLKAPDEVLIATNEYRAEMDVLSAFINDCCVVNPHSKAASSQIYSAYVEWCAQNGEKALPQRGFGMKLKERGFTPGHTRQSRFWGGIGLMDTHADHWSD